MTSVYIVVKSDPDQNHRLFKLTTLFYGFPAGYIVSTVFATEVWFSTQLEVAMTTIMHGAPHAYQVFIGSRMKYPLTCKAVIERVGWRVRTACT